VATEGKESAIVRYMRESWSELRKVVWPSQQETIRLTGVVMGVSLVVGLLLGAIDFLLTSVIPLLERLGT